MRPAVVEVTRSPSGLGEVVAGQAAGAVLALAVEAQAPAAVVAGQAAAAQARLPVDTGAAPVGRVGPVVVAAQDQDPAPVAELAAAPGRAQAADRPVIAVNPVAVLVPAPAAVVQLVAAPVAARVGPVPLVPVAAEGRRESIAAVPVAIAARVPVVTEADRAVRARVGIERDLVVGPPMVLAVDREMGQLPVDIAVGPDRLVAVPVARAMTEPIQEGPGPRVVTAVEVDPLGMGRVVDRAMTGAIGTATTTHRQSFRPVPRGSRVT